MTTTSQAETDPGAQAMARLAREHPELYAKARATPEPYALTRAYLRSFGLPTGTHREIANLLGISKPYVYALKHAHELDPALYQRFLEGEVSLCECYSTILAARKPKGSRAQKCAVPAAEEQLRKVTFPKVRRNNLPELSAQELVSLIRYAQQSGLAIAELLAELNRN